MVVPGVGTLYGVKVPVLRKLARTVHRAYRQDPSGLKAIALEAWRRGSREHRLCALFLLANAKDISPADRWSLGVGFLPDVTNWEVCDQLCMALLGQALAEIPGYMDVLETWLEDENLWVRRAALVVPVLLRRASYPAELALDLDRRTLALCANLLDDREKYIRKAVDWSIREVLRRHYDLARDWLLAQASAGPSRAARTTLKLSAKKLRDEDRRAFLAALGEE